MTSPTSISGFRVKTGRAALTATALAAMLMLAGEDELPSRYYALNPPFISGYQWEIREAYDQAPGVELLAMEQFGIIQQFVAKIAAQSKDIDPRYDQLISENFWELV
jgi:hypothetical protein